MAIQKRAVYNVQMPFRKRIAVARAKDVIWVDYDPRYAPTLSYLVNVYTFAVNNGIVFG